MWEYLLLTCYERIIFAFPDKRKAGELLVNEQLIDRLAQGKPSLARRVLDAIRDVLAQLKRTLSRSEVEPLEQAARLWEQALRDTNRAYWQEGQRPESGEVRNNATTEGGGDARYSLKGVTEDGIEVYETSEEIKKLPYKERVSKFLELMREEYIGRTAKFSTNNDVYYAKFDEADLRKNVYGDKKSSSLGWKAKINTGADGNIFELIENARYSRSGTERGKNTEAHRNLTGWDYFVKTVQIDGRMYDLLANVRKKPDGEYVYSIQLNERKNKASAPPRQYQNDTAEAENRPVRVPTDAIDTVPQTKNSVKGTRALQKQVEALTRQNQRLKEQMKRTDTVKASRKAVEQQAREIRKAYQSRIDKAALADRIDSLYQKMGQLGSSLEGGGAIVTEEDIRTEARGIAEDMQKVNSAYTKKNPAAFVMGSEVMHMDEKRAPALLRRFGLTIASRGLLRSGSVGNITYSGGTVNMTGVPFYDVVDIGQTNFNKKEELSTAAAGENTASAIQESSSADTVTQTAKKSVKGTRALQKQVEALTRQNQRLKEQMKRTDTVKASRKAVEQRAGEIRKAYQSRIDKAALADRIDSYGWKKESPWG